jgi:putative peptide zinc metalloprotease protein
MRRLRSLTALVLAIAALAGATAGPAGAEGNGPAPGDTSAVAINTKDNSLVFALAFSIRQIMGSTVDNRNTAVAYASCTACQTVAISIQILLVASNPTVFVPQNIAVAINENCTLCDTLASAYQFAVGIGTRLRFTGAGRRSLAAIRRELEALRHSGLTGPEIQARLDALMARLSEVLRTQLVPVDEERRDDQPGDHSSDASPGDDSTDRDTTPEDAPGGNGDGAPAPGEPGSTTEPQETEPDTQPQPEPSPPPGDDGSPGPGTTTEPTGTSTAPAPSPSGAPPG